MFLLMINDKFLERGDFIIKLTWKFLRNLCFLSKYKAVSLHEAGMTAVGCLEVS